MADTLRSAHLSTWMINLPASHERLQRMEAQLAQLPLAFDRVDAVDGRQEWETLSGSLNVSRFERNVGRKVLPGEIGCYLSHLAAWQNILTSGASFGLVLEDDVVFHQNFLEALDVGLALEKHWDILKLNFIRAKMPVAQHKHGQWCINLYLGPFTGMGAYLIRASTIKALMPRMLPIERPIDHALDMVHKYGIRHRGLTPFPSHVQDDQKSTITGAAFSDIQRFSNLRRLPVHTHRFSNLLSKTADALMGQIFSR